jgi:hypothetical protein
MPLLNVAYPSTKTSANGSVLLPYPQYYSNIHSYSRSNIIQDSFPDIRSFVAHDGCIYQDEITTPEFKPTILFIPIRLGIDALNPVYIPHLKQLFHSSHFLGIAGGKPNTSLYFVGYVDDTFIYLDPHYVQDTIPIKHENEYTPQVHSFN